MPHLTIEYSAGMEAAAEMPGLLAALRDAMMETGLFPLGGVRVRAFAATHALVAEGGPHDFAHMMLRLGEGRTHAQKAAAMETIYAAAEAWLAPRMADRGFALSLDVAELAPGLSIKRHNTVRDHMKAE